MKYLILPLLILFLGTSQIVHGEAPPYYIAGVQNAPADGWWTPPYPQEQFEFLFQNGQMVQCRHKKSMEVWDSTDNGRTWVKAKTVTNYGVDKEKWTPGSGGIMYQGRTISKAEAMRLLEAEVPNDAGKWHLTVFGNKELHVQFQAVWDQNKKLSDWAVLHLMKVDDFRGKAWDLNTVPAFQQSKTAVFVQQPDGRVIHGQFQWSQDDMKWLAEKFDPTKVPDQRGGGLDLNKALDQLIARIKADPIPWVIIGVVLLYIFMNREKQCPTSPPK